MFFLSVVLRQINIGASLFSVSYSEKAVRLTCDKALAYSLTSEAYKIQNLTNVMCRRLNPIAKAGLPRGAFTNLLNKTKVCPSPTVA